MSKTVNQDGEGSNPSVPAKTVIKVFARRVMASVSVKPNIPLSNILNLQNDSSDEKVGVIVSVVNGGDPLKVGTYVFIHSDTVVLLDGRLGVFSKQDFAAQYVVQGVLSGVGTIDLQVSP